MALSLDGYRSRIANELSLLGDFALVRDELIKDALVDLIIAVEPVIAATIAVVTTSKEYDIPSTIEKIHRIQNSIGKGVVYSLNEYTRKITLQDSQSADGTLYVWGTPRDPRTNAESIITALPEHYGKTLWAYVRYACYDMVDSDKASEQLIKAEKEAHKLLQAVNASPGYFGQTIRIVDVTGATLGDSGAADGINVTYNEFGQADT